MMKLCLILQAASDAEDSSSGRSEGKASASSGSGSDANSGDGAAVQVWHQLCMSGYALLTCKGVCLHTVSMAGTLRSVLRSEPAMRRP